MTPCRRCAEPTVTGTCKECGQEVSARYTTAALARALRELPKHHPQRAVTRHEVLDAEITRCGECDRRYLPISGHQC